MQFLVAVQGKLIVSADSKEAAIERANVFVADHGLPSFKAQPYGTEQVEDSTVVQPALAN
jgi:hypothetical protein